MKLNAKELRDVKEEDIAGKLKMIKRRPMYFILENVYDTYNIGGLFRLADALAIEKMYICGESEIPPNSKIKKASIGTYKVVPWEYRKTAGEVITEIRSWELKRVKKFELEDGNESNFKLQDSKLASKPNFHLPISIIAVEQHKKSIPYTEATYTGPVALILGNETSGVTEETLKLADQIVEMPMWGINRSLNVIVSAAIVSYWAVNKI
ncbi:MAG: tRNA/rRNA methyltransferase [Candidatus Roizmanbacteria bacterium GW2011_GWA2_35_19]|uniref:tRNA/rRNA methyltransferase n=1 Tax=Candidatus Roizmanbacteria bacterium GW2011_GWA2_35_19 TaxID=1618478 RepID=A0A0G0C5W0_9BACT|nr:MAG: tRNA/rRNA methyltransferase [Candidatus Roizmanbacteria bacterium GW2011_GWA2_35_19]